MVPPRHIIALVAAVLTVVGTGIAVRRAPAGEGSAVPATEVRGLTFEALPSEVPAQRAAIERRFFVRTARAGRRQATTTTTPPTTTTQPPTTTTPPTTAPTTTTTPPPTTTTQPPTTTTTAAPTTTTAAPTNSEVGQASWYRHREGICAHRTLPLGTIVTVHAVDHGTSTTCEVGDRGPFVEGRIIDLDASDFEDLAPLSVGVIDVRIEW